MTTFTNLTGAAEIGANCYLISRGSTHLILDAGMHPKKIGNEARPQLELLDTRPPQSIFITHAHIDHIGTLPVLQDLFPLAEVNMTNATAEVGGAMLHNSVNVMSSQRLFDGIVEYPFFTHGELERAENQWKRRAYEQPFITAGGEVLATLYDAGHILGSCGVLLELKDGLRLFYTGDVQFNDQSLIPGAAFPEEGVDVLIMECTHGATQQAGDYTRARELERLGCCIREVLTEGGAVLIPVFALGKSQELLYELGRLRKMGKIPAVPIYFGGLGAKVTHLYDRLADSTRRLHPGLRLFDEVEICGLPNHGAPSVSPGNIYFVSSGMMSPHTLSNALAAQILPQHHHAILFVGYSDPDSPAARIKSSKPGDQIRLGPLPDVGQAYPRNCRVECFDFSGHATRDALISYARRLNPRHIVLVHGDPEAQRQMSGILGETMPNTRISIPMPGEELVLD